MSYKGKRIMQLVFIILLALQFIFSATAKLNCHMLARFESWGYTEEFMYLIGTIEFTAAIGLFINRTKVLSIVALVMIMIGAIYTHLSYDQYFEVLINIGLIGLLTIVLWLEREMKLAPEDVKNSNAPF
ncbi:MAG: DoxX family protein [Fulvivirga sp.]|nr:DoxX family protein [Fulvivirga sp.]